MANGPITSPGEGQARLSTAAAHQLKVRHIQRVVSPTVAFNAAQLAQYNPRLDAGVIGGLSMAGVTPDDPIMQLVSERAQYEQDIDAGKFDRDAGIFGEWVANPFKGAIRGAFMGLEGLMQEAESLFVRTPVGIAQGLSPGEAFEKAGRSDAYYALNAAMSGKRVHAGTGFFAQDQSQDDAYIQSQLKTGRSLTDVLASREYAEANAQYGVDVAQLGEAERSEMQITHGPSGKTTPVSLGRLAAIQVFEPGTRQFQMTSGLVDAGKQIFLDPADLALGGVGKYVKLRKLFYTADELANPNFASKAMQGLKAGLVDNPTRKTIVARTVDQWMDSTQGQGLMKFIQEQEGPEGARTLYELFGQKRKATLDPNFIRDLTDETDLTEIRRILKAENEKGSLMNVPKMPNQWSHFKRGLNGTILGRYAAVTPGKMLNIEDPGSALFELDNYTLNLGLNATQRNEILERALHISPDDTVKYGGEATDQDLYSQYFQLVKDATNLWIDNMNLPIDDPMRAAMNKIFDSPDAHRSFWKNNVGEDVMFGGANVTTTVNGKTVAAPSAVMFSQFLNQGIPLMDSKVIRSAMRRDFVASGFGKARDDVAPSATEKWLRNTFGNEDWDEVGNSAIIQYMDGFMSKIWKPSVLLRVAWPMRVIGEEQLRLSGKLMVGAFNHPLQYMALMATEKWPVLNKAARMTNDAMLNSFLDDANYEAGMATRQLSTAEAMTGKKAGPGGRGIRYEGVAKDKLSDRELMTAYQWELNQVRNNELSVKVAEALHGQFDEATGKFDESGLAGIKEQFFGGELDYLRRQMLRDTQRWNLLNDRAFADGYIDTIYAKMTHLAGGQGFLLDPVTKRWRNFDGTEISPTEIRARFAQGADPEAPTTPLYQMFGDEGANEAMQGAEETLINELGRGEGDRIFAEMQEQWDRIYDETMNVDQATTEALRLGDDLVEDAKTRPGAGMPELGDTEMIPTLEARTGVGEWAERPSFVGAYQTNRMRQLSDETNMHWMGGLEEQAEMGGVMKLGEGMLRDVEEFQGMGPLTLQLQDEWDDVYEAYGRAYTRWDDGKAVAGITVLVDPDTEKAIGVAYTGGLDMKELTNLQRELVETGVLSYEDVFKFNAGNIPFDEWLRKQGVDVDGMTPDELWAHLDSNPDILKKFEGHYDDADQWVPGTNPRTGPTSTTRAGSVFTRRGVQAAREDAQNWPQHMAHFQSEGGVDPRIFEMIATGKITDADGAVLLDWGKKATTNKGVKKQFNHRTSYFMGDAEHWRNQAPGFVNRPQATDEAMDIKRWDAAVDLMMQTLMSKPSDKLSRSPAFRQFYWKRASAMAANLNEADRIKFLEAAGKANLLEKSQGNTGMGKAMRAVRRFSGRENTVDEALRYVKNLEGKAARMDPGGITTLAELDQVAKMYALQETKNLLYDLSKSHNMTEALRLMIPFGEAWFEVGSTWGKLLIENPRNIRRLQQGVEGAKESNPFEDTGPDGEQGRGFFFPDPNTGEELFAFPGMGLIPEWMPFIGGYGEVADQHEMVGRAEGLNMMAQIMPGIGPLLQIPMSHMGWTDDVDKKWLRDILMPFGKTEFTGTDPTTWVSPVLPTWVNKALQSFGTGGESNKRLFANTTMDVYKTLLMQGWSDDTPEDMAKTLDHAKGIAGDLTRIRALSNFAAPTAAGNLWEVRYTPEDTDGELWSYQNLATAYRQMLDEANGDEVQAFKSFQDIFGLDPMLFAVSKTQKVLPRAVTLEARKWEQDNEDLYQDDAYPLTAYFAAPDPAEGEFDYESYLVQLDEETRVPLTPEQWALKRNQFLGRVAYSNFQRVADRRFQDQTQKTLWLRNTFSGLQELFPGYGQNIVGMPAKPTLDMQLRELAQWANEPRLAGTEAGQALADYLSYRQNIINLTQAKLGYTSDTGFRTGKQSAIYRRQLRARGQTLVAENPDFLPMWQQILSRELEEPESTMAPVNIAGVTF